MLHQLERDQIDQSNPRLLRQLVETLELNSDDLFAFSAEYGLFGRRIGPLHQGAPVLFTDYF